MPDSDKFTQLFIRGKIEEAKSLVQEYLENGLDVNAVLNQGMIKAMEQIGEKFSNGDIFLPEMMVAARCMPPCLEIIKPILVKNEESTGKVVIIGTVAGDLHDVGKNLVAMMLVGGGFEVIDLGVDISAAKFVELAKKHKAKIIGISALLTTTMPMVQTTVEALKASDVAGEIKTLVGGAPVTEKFARKIGADGYAKDAAGAVKMAKQLVG
jgi:5-methyltetrahydrofolate--homocysteine methyltransferase